MQRPDASVLIWVESGAELIREPVVGRHRGMLIVAHGSGHGHTERSFIISHPIDTDDHAEHVPAVSGVLEGTGWSILTSRRGKVVGDEVNTAVLVNFSHSGPGHRLWLAEPVGATQVRSASAHAPAPVRSPALPVGWRATSLEWASGPRWTSLNPDGRIAARRTWRQRELKGCIVSCYKVGGLRAQAPAPIVYYGQNPRLNDACSLL